MRRSYAPILLLAVLAIILVFMISGCDGGSGNTVQSFKAGETVYWMETPNRSNTYTIHRGIVSSAPIDGDRVFISCGCHPCVASPGYVYKTEEGAVQAAFGCCGGSVKLCYK